MVKMRKSDKDEASLIKMYERGFPVGFKAVLEVGAGAEAGGTPEGATTLQRSGLTGPRGLPVRGPLLPHPAHGP